MTPDSFSGSKASMAGAKLLYGILGVLALVACQDDRDGRTELADGSFLSKSRFRNGPLVQGVRCWASGNEFDCVRLTRFEPPTILVTRYRVATLASSGRERVQFGCLFDPAPGEWFAQIISRAAIQSESDAEFINRVRRTGPKLDWTKPEVTRRLRELGVHVDHYLDCRKIYKSMLLEGADNILESKSLRV